VCNVISENGIVYPSMYQRYLTEVQWPNFL